MEREIIFAKEGCWLTQSEKNQFRPRIFLKNIPIKYGDREQWINWTEEKYQEYCKENGPMSVEKIVKYMENFDYTKDKSFFGFSPEKIFHFLISPIKPFSNKNTTFKLKRNIFKNK